jgi:methyl-accepting chemotaxis protein
MVSHLHTAQREQTKGGDQILQAIEALRELARNQETRLGEFHRSIEVIARTAEALSTLAQARHRVVLQRDGEDDEI